MPPSKTQQVNAVMEFLDSEKNEGRSLKEIATQIVDGYHEMLQAGVKKPATPLRQGMLLKSPYDAKVRRVAYLDDAEGVVWIVSETSSYGWLGPLSPPTWEYCEEYNPKKRTEVDGKGKMVEMTEADIEQAWSNPDWQVGDRLSQRQRQFRFTVIAVGPSCALLQQDGVPGEVGLVADSNHNLGKFYRREAEW